MTLAAMNFALFSAALRDSPLLGVLAAVMVCIVLAGWLAGGGYLLARGYRKATQQRYINWPKGALAAFLSGSAAAIGAIIFQKLVATIGAATNSDLQVVSLVMAILIAAFVAFLVLYAFYQLPAWKVAKIGAVSLGSVAVLAAVAALIVWLPARRVAIDKLNMEKSIGRLRIIDETIRLYEKTPAGQPPATLMVLTQENTIGNKKYPALIPEDMLRYEPRLPGRAVAYFYVPSPSVADKRSEKLRACEFTHPLVAEGRAVLFDNTNARSVPESEFQRLLTLTENRDFAAKFREAEQKK